MTDQLATPISTCQLSLYLALHVLTTQYFVHTAMWRHAAGVAVCVGPATMCRSVLKTECGKHVPLLFEKKNDDLAVEPAEVLFVRRSSHLGFMVWFSTIMSC